MLRGVLVVICALAAGYFGFLLATFFSSKPSSHSGPAAPSSLPPATVRSAAATTGQQPLVQTPTQPGNGPASVAATGQTANQSPAQSVPTPQPPSQQQQPPTSASRRAAPGGSYFLNQRVTVTTDSGVIGIDAGTQVVLLEQLESGNFIATNGPEDFEIAPEQITNDPAAAGVSAQKNGGVQQVLAIRKQRQLRPPPRNTPPPAGTPVQALPPDAPAPRSASPPAAPPHRFPNPYVTPPPVDVPGVP